MKFCYDYLSGFFQLFFPDLCIACAKYPKIKRELFCIKCLTELPFTSSIDHAYEAIRQKLWGRVEIESAAAMFYFQEKGKVQKLIHKIKYQGREDIALNLGRFFAKKIQINSCLRESDFIVPVPLHKSRLHSRGFNQSEAFGRGFSEVMQIPMKVNLVKRIKATSSQTKKSRTDRIKNVTNAFLLMDPEEAEGKHFLLVDDVLTTGATLESCILELQKCPDVKISVACIGIARH